MSAPAKHAFTDDEFDDPLFDAAGYDALGEPTTDDKNWGLIAHLAAFAGLVIPFGNFVGPLVVMLTKRDTSAFAEASAREALNFQITAFLAAIAFGVLSFVLIGIPLLIALGVAWFVLPVLAAIRTSEGTLYRYPFTLRLIK